MGRPRKIVTDVTDAPVQQSAETVAEKLEKIARENELLKQKIAEQEALRDRAVSGYSPILQDQIRKIRLKGKSTANTIVVKESHDHKNISLWTRDGKRIGPMHPDNAERFLNDAAASGRILTVDKPTEAQIEAYKQTDEYKAFRAREVASRERKDRLKKGNQTQKLIEEIARMSGKTVEAINNIFDKFNVVKPGDAQVK